MITLYGISNCDTVKKAIKWLEKNNHSFKFHDFRKDGCDDKLIERFLEKIPAESLINKRSTTYRNLTDEEKDLFEGDLPVELLCQQPTLIKRPILQLDEKFSVGFSDTQYHSILQ